MQDQEPESPSAKPAPEGSRGRGRLNPRSERKSLEVFGGAPASTRYLPGASVSFGGKSVPEVDEESVDASPLPLPLIEPPWAAPIVAPKPNSATAGPSQGGIPAPLPHTWSAPKSSPALPASKPAEPKAPMPWEINLDIPEYKPKPVIGSDDTDPKAKRVIRHQRSSSDGLKAELLDLAEERQTAIEKLKKQAEELAKRDTATKPSPKSPEKKEMPESVMADRAAQWGLVLKADEQTGKAQGVQTRKSEESRRASGESRR